MKNANKLYLAYGSNLNLEQMGFRCPYAIPVGVTTLSGYRLLFRGGCNGNAVATVEPEEKGSVPALIWEITPRDEEALDRYEGWPRLYRKETVTVPLNGKPVEVMVYIMNEIYPMGTPSEHYLNVITEGYASAGFDTAVLDEAVKVSNQRKRPGMQFPSRETVKRVRESYPHGCRVELISMNDPHTTLRHGDQGTVDHVDDTGTVFVNWDSGSHLGAVYGVDHIKLCEDSIDRDGKNAI